MRNDYVVLFDAVYPDRINFAQSIGAKTWDEAVQIKADLKGGNNEDIRIIDVREC